MLLGGWGTTNKKCNGRHEILFPSKLCPHNYGMISANNPTYICSVLKKGLNKRATAPPKECRLRV